ncbi:MAG TPA: hypothetical protein VF530_00395 [Planctomycetota bacterium]
MLLVPLVLALVPQTAAAHTQVTFVEPFDVTNTGNWSFFGNPANPIEVRESSGGNPGAFLHSTCAGLGCLDTFAPELRTQRGVPSLFNGDYRAKGVTQLGVDLAVFGPPGVTTGGRPLSLILRHDPGTPMDPFDDVVVYRVGPRNIPPASGTWRSYDFRVPTASASLPAGWVVQQGTGDDDADWNTVVADVTQVGFFFGDPSFFFIFQQWELGVDNVRIRLDGRVLR